MNQHFNQRAAGEERRDIYQRVTDRIIADLEKDVRPWVQPWKSDNPAVRPLRHNGQPYSGVNVLMLWSVAVEKGYANPMWMTFRQARELDAHVRKGEKSSVVVYANRVTKTTKSETGDDVEREIPFLRGYSVFNVEQIDGLPEQYYAGARPMFANPAHRIEYADAFFGATGAEIRHQGRRAFYVQQGDYIQIPPIEDFFAAEKCYATLAHEITHWTKHSDRLARDFGRKSWGDEGYAMEELVAELGAAFLCADLEITPEVREDHAAYIACWLKVLKNDKRAIFQAASHAQRAADYLVKAQVKPAETSEDIAAPQIA
jgi:antirestriction protein ArdC